MKKTLLLILASLVLISSSMAGVPQEINYQGMLQDSAGTAIDDTVKMIFTIYESTTATANLWTETQTAVTVEAGIYNVRLGSVDTIPMSVFQDGLTKYLGVTVGTDSEMIPRLPIVAVPYAIYATSAESATYAENAKNAENATTADFATSAQSAQTAITAETISTAVNAETVDGFSASSVPTANTLLALDGSGTFSISNSQITGKAISAEATASSGIHYGGYFAASGSLGQGVYGNAIKYGVHGQSSTGTGIRGQSDSGTAIKADTTNGTCLIASVKTSGTGISIEGNADTGIYAYGKNVAGHFVTDQTTGKAISAEATASSDTDDHHGGYFVALGTKGVGAWGKTDTGTGVKGTASSGKGVHGYAETNGTGVYAQNTNTTGNALYIKGKLGAATGTGNCVGTSEIPGSSNTVDVTNVPVTANSLIFLTVGHAAAPAANVSDIALKIYDVNVGSSQFTVRTVDNSTPANAVPFSYLIIN